MMTQHLWIDGEWCEARDPGAGAFQASDPRLMALLPERYPIAGLADVERAVQAGLEAARELARIEPERIAAFLERYAREIEGRGEELVERAALETGLPAAPRLRDVELPRTTSQLRQAAAAARDRSWRQIVIDTRANLRTTFEPLGGPVVVFGPSNFPFAFNAVSGGDFAAAIAAGNPVIAKAHPGHPGTSQLLARACDAALRAADLPRATVQLLYHLPDELGLELVSHSRVGAVAFTGSASSGLRLKAAADSGGVPIYLELSGTNPVFILRGALEERLVEIAEQLTGSCALGAGQFCTKPGISVLCAGQLAERFVGALQERFQATEPGVLLGPSAPEAIGRVIESWSEAGAELVCGGKALTDRGHRFEPTLFRVPANVFLKNSELWNEAFGTVHLVVVARDFAQLLEVADALDGDLTGSIYSHTGELDDADYRELEPVLKRRVGRLLNDKMPTGVLVSPAMHHGGPYPATGHPGFTSVGIPAALTRFAARRCYDAVRPQRLPPELRDEALPAGPWRQIDGQWTRNSVKNLSP